MDRPRAGARHQGHSVVGQTDGGEHKAVEVDLLNYPGPGEMLDSLVRSHRVDVLTVRGESQVREGLSLDNNLMDSLA